MLLWRQKAMIRKPFSTLAVLVFVLVTLAHLHRLLFGWEVLVNGARVPIWTSVLAVFLAGLLAWGVWRESRRDRG